MKCPDCDVVGKMKALDETMIYCDNCLSKWEHTGELTAKDWDRIEKKVETTNEPMTESELAQEMGY